MGEHAKADTAYVVAEQTYLRDRVAAVSTRVALVSNGDPLEVVERGRRFLKVKTGKGEVGWIEQHLVIEQPVFNQFVELKQHHQDDPVVATGVLRDALYLHLKPGRDSERFYLLPENDKLQLLIRASVPKQGPGYLPPPKPVAPAVAQQEKSLGMPSGKTQPAKVGPRLSPSLSPRLGPNLGPNLGKMSTVSATDAPKDTPPVPMEDWWLVRDSQGKIGWLLARRMDVDVPDEIGGYSEGQRMVGAYLLTKVYDSESNLPDKQVPIYLAVLNAYKDGLPYDFDQIRVFTWNVRKHRYETAYRQRNLEGYLPVHITQEKIDKGPPVPVFAIRVATSDPVTADPQSGGAGPTRTETLRFALEGPIVKRISPPTTLPLASPAYARSAAKHAAHQHHSKTGG
ncbi:MAG TPA: SH3 domain-containing protein [Acidobacteriaceae bacterium]